MYRLSRRKSVNEDEELGLYFFLADQKEELNDSMEHFWEVETLGIPLAQH